VQIATEDGKTYLFDIISLGAAAFSRSRLKDLLESKATTKTIYDGRADADALYHHFGVCLFEGKVCDVQYLYCKRHDASTDRYLKGLAKAMQRAYWMTSSERKALDDVKDAGKRQWCPTLGGRYSVWKERPMPAAMIAYAVADVWHLHEMAVRWGELERPEVYGVTSSRVRKAALGPHTPQGPHMARKDW
jgi:exonuclease 3'-5' domain-containing protein 1